MKCWKECLMFNCLYHFTIHLPGDINSSEIYFYDEMGNPDRFTTHLLIYFKYLYVTIFIIMAHSYWKLKIQCLGKIGIFLTQNCWICSTLNIWSGLFLKYHSNAMWHGSNQSVAQRTNHFWFREHPDYISFSLHPRNLWRMFFLLVIFGFGLSTFPHNLQNNYLDIINC